MDVLLQHIPLTLFIIIIITQRSSGTEQPILDPSPALFHTRPLNFKVRHIPPSPPPTSTNPPLSPATMLLPTYLTVFLPTLAAAGYVSGIDMLKACNDDDRFHGGGTYGVVQKGDTCNDWKCTWTNHNNLYYEFDVNVPMACKLQNRWRTDLTARCTGGIYGWGCYE